MTEFRNTFENMLFECEYNIEKYKNITDNYFNKIKIANIIKYQLGMIFNNYKNIINQYSYMIEQIWLELGNITYSDIDNITHIEILQLSFINLQIRNKKIYKEVKEININDYVIYNIDNTTLTNIKYTIYYLKKLYKIIKKSCKFAINMNTIFINEFFEIVDNITYDSDISNNSDIDT